jgi:deoxycytidylate deaminase
MIPKDSRSQFQMKKQEKKDHHPLRPSWDEYFMDITHLVSKRSTCLRRQVGSVLVKDKKILATGYNGAPSRIEHCLDIGCLPERDMNSAAASMPNRTASFRPLTMAWEFRGRRFTAPTIRVSSVQR